MTHITGRTLVRLARWVDWGDVSHVPVRCSVTNVHTRECMGRDLLCSHHTAYIPVLSGTALLPPGSPQGPSCWLLVRYIWCRVGWLGQPHLPVPVPIRMKRIRALLQCDLDELLSFSVPRCVSWKRVLLWHAKAKSTANPQHHCCHGCAWPRADTGV